MDDTVQPPPTASRDLEITPETPRKFEELELKGETTSISKEIDDSAQAGVRAVEAAAAVWTKWHLVAAYAMYVAFQSNVYITVSSMAR